MKIFLTGPKGIGKSTIIGKVLAAHPSIKVYGYLTRFSADKKLYMLDASKTDLYGFAEYKRYEKEIPEAKKASGKNLNTEDLNNIRAYIPDSKKTYPYVNSDSDAVSFNLYNDACLVAESGPCGMKAIDGAFYHIGKSLVKPAGDGELLILDEIGFIEAGDAAFGKFLADAVNSSKNVLGVIREGLPGFGKELSALPGVTLINVTEENRDKVAEKIAEM